MWKEFEIDIVNKELQDLGVKNAEYPVPAIIKTDDIIFYYKTHSGEDRKEGVTVYFKGGENITLNIEYDTFKKIMQHP